MRDLSIVGTSPVFQRSIRCQGFGAFGRYYRRMDLPPVSYRRTRLLLTGVGLIILALIALVMYVRRVDAIEVLGTLFFLPVFLGAMFWGWRGGVVLGLLSAAGYAALRYPAIAAVGPGRFAGLVLGRSAGYLLFGGIGGWAADQLRASIGKLDLYDQIDDATGLLNARALLESIDMERSRADRYEKVFSVAWLEFTFPSKARRRAAGALKDLGRDLSRSIRGADRAGHAADAGGDLVVVVLPETGEAGAAAFLANLRSRAAETFARASIEPVTLGGSTVTYPGGDLETLDVRLRTATAHEFGE